MQEIAIPVRPHDTAIQAVIRSLSYGDVAGMVRKARGAYLSQLVDAARDVAEQSPSDMLRATAEQIIAAARVYHPEYWDPTLRGVM